MNSKTSASDGRFDNIDKQLGNIAKVVVEGFDRVDRALETKAESVDIRKIFSLLDGQSKLQIISDDERLVMGHQLERLNRWTQELAKKIGYKLTI